LVAATGGLVVVGPVAAVAPATGSVTDAFVCPNPPAGCGSGNHNQVRL